MSIALCGLLLLAVSGPVRTQPPESRDLVLVTNACRDDVRAIEAAGAWVNYVNSEGVAAEATQTQQSALIAAGYGVKVIIPDITGIYERNFSESFGQYLTYQQFVDTMRTIAQNNPGICKLETLGTSYGGRQLLIMKVSDNPQMHENEPAVHFEGDIHGDEKIGWAITFELLKYLVSRYGTDTLVTRLVDTREIWLNPMYNPDGYNNSVRYNGNNVDLNRNWGWMWGGENNQGASAFSEPENRATLRHIWRQPFVTFVSYHAGTRFISYPWSYCYSYQNTIPEVAAIRFLSARYDQYTGYTYGQGSDSMYLINGSTKDFDYGYGMMGWSIEVHMTKTPPASEIDPTFNANRPAMFALMHHAGQGIHGTVTDAVTGQPVHAQVWVNPANWPNYTHPDGGDFHRFYLPGTYSVTFRAPGYRDTTVADVVVPNSGDSAVNISVQLYPDPAAPLFAFRHVYNSYVTPSNNNTYPVRALGPHDSTGFQLDNGKYICLDMGRPIRNNDGVDMTVYRSAGSGTATVQGSNSWEGPWTNIGTANQARTDFDLAAAGLDSIRYVRLTASGQFYLDAVEGVNYTAVAEQPAPPARPVMLPTLVRNVLPLPPSASGVLLDISGRAAARLEPGLNDLRRLPAGVYFVELNSPDPRPHRVVIAR
ncbi:MAG: M14 family zinc carboxypeptidase [candidate division WOR-3 bacterium]